MFYFLTGSRVWRMVTLVFGVSHAYCDLANFYKSSSILIYMRALLDMKLQRKRNVRLVVPAGDFLKNYLNTIMHNILGSVGFWALRLPLFIFIYVKYRAW